MSNKMKEERIAEIKDNRNGKEKVKSNAVTANDVVWNRNTGNTYVDNVLIDESEQTGAVTINGRKFSVRMPWRGITKKIQNLKVKEKKGKVVGSDKDIQLAQEIYEEMALDMLPDLDFDDPKLRLTDPNYTDILAFTFSFYRFFVQKSQAQASEQYSSNEEA